MDGPGWTSSAIFSKNGITRRTRREVFTRVDLRGICSFDSSRRVHRHPTLYPSQVISLPQSSCFLSSSQSQNVRPYAVIPHILMYSVSYTCFHVRLSPLPLLSLPLPIGLHTDSLSASVAYIYHRPLSSLENSFTDCCLLLYGHLLSVTFWSFML